HITNDLCQGPAAPRRTMSPRRSNQKLATWRVKTVALVVVPPVEELDLIGPLEAFTGVNRVLGKRGPAYDVKVVSSDSERMIAGDCGVSLGQGTHVFGQRRH